MDLLKTLIDKINNRVSIQLKYSPEVSLPIPLYFVNTNESVEDFMHALMERFRKWVPLPNPCLLPCPSG